MRALRTLVISLLPQSIKDAIGQLNKRLYRGDKYNCPICGSDLKHFLRLSDKFDVVLDINDIKYTVKDYETLNIDNYMCPVCRCSDRDRLFALYFKDNPEVLKPDSMMIHFAPEKSLSCYFSRTKKNNYFTADLYMQGVDYNLDITDMHILPSDSFDGFICSHILEHVPDDLKAMKELFRILKPGARGIVMTPLIPALNSTYEDFTKTTKEDRLRHFGKEDHVRVYSKNGFIEKLERTGFAVHQMGVDDFGESLFNKSGIQLKSVLYIARKPGNGSATTRSVE